MLREVLRNLSFLFGACDHPYRLAEIILFGIVCLVIGCCVGAFFTTLILSPAIRTVLTKLLIVLLEGNFGDRARDLAGQNRLQRYRA